MSQFVHIAKPFYEATELMSCEKYASLSSVIPVINNLSGITKDNSRSGQGTEQLRSFAKNLCSEMNSRFPNNYTSSKYHLLAMLVDLRLKEILIDDCNEKSQMLLTFIKTLSKGPQEPILDDSEGLKQSPIARDDFWGPFQSAAKRRKLELSEEGSDHGNQKLINEIASYMRDSVIDKNDDPIKF